MKVLLMICIFICICFKASAQKQLIDSSVYGKWRGVDGIALSNDGAYVSYNIPDSMQNNSMLYVQSIDGYWKKGFINTGWPRFSPDGKKMIFSKGKDSLCFVTLGTDSMIVIPHVSNWEMPRKGNSPWIAFQLSEPRKNRILHNTITGEERAFKNISSFMFAADGFAVLLQKETGDQQVTLQWIDLSNGQTVSIWQGKMIADLGLDQTGTRLFFKGQDGSSEGISRIWIYKQGGPQAVSVELNEQENALKIDDVSILGFDHTGNKLFFKVNKPVAKLKPNPALASVDVYSYKDAQLQSQQLIEQPQRSYRYVYNFSNRRTIRLEEKNEEIKSPLDGDQILIQKSGNGDLDYEYYWNKNALSSFYLVSTKDGKRKCIVTKVALPNTLTYTLSPSGKYLIWYDPDKKGYFCYNIKTDIVKKVTIGIKKNWANQDASNHPDSAYEVGENILGWTANDSSFWLGSRYDIYQVDPEGKRLPINLTNGYGSKHHLIFRIYSTSQELYGEPTALDSHKSVLLHFINDENKDEGFCRVRVGQQEDPDILSVMPKHISNMPEAGAADADIYAVSIEDEKSAPNYFLTRDFKTFSQLTGIQPQKDYNWLTSELVKWRRPDGKTTQGVLYKPENFDPKKRYPVIFFYYEIMSNNLHKFHYPQIEDAQMLGIPYYVSNGYLVFLPDIQYKIGYPGRSSCNTIVSAAEYLSKFPWVDKTKMGLMGHSFGGFETNYVITHSQLFAAAISSSGITDFVSQYGSRWGNEIKSSQIWCEATQGRIGATLWQRPDLYIENSPVFRADKVTTPVLLMANKNDGSASFRQGFEFFTGLRRLGKKAWLLQYDNGEHGLHNHADKEDFTIRSHQFFDHYLNGALPPKWMTEGVPAIQKQIDPGYATDTTGKRP
jgi:dipeptidyl aminopeptidase/acylaminoacyl peptidase